MTTSSHPFGFHVPGPVPVPVPLQNVSAMQAAAVAGRVPAPPAAQMIEPLYPMCVACGDRRDLAPRGQERYSSGASVLVCRDGCQINPAVRAATGVITAAMTNGAMTPQEWAQAEHDAGLLFDPQRAKDIASAADAAARADMRAQLNQAREDRQSMDWFHSRYRAVGQLCEGRRPTDVLTVTEVLTAIDGKAPGGPLGITWEGVLAGPHGDREPTLLGCFTTRGGVAILSLDDDQRADLAAKLATVHRAEACTTPGCGLADGDLDESDPTVWGWIRLDVAGTDDDPRWWCSPACATAAMAAAGAELAAADQMAAITPVPDTVVVEESGPRCVRCGCTEQRACEGGCHWVPNAALLILCSACASPAELAFAGLRPQGGQGADA